MQLHTLQCCFLNAMRDNNIAFPFSSQNLHPYRNNTRSALLRALEQIYPICLQLVGESFFTQLVREYSAAHPSRFFSLNDYGENFGDFIANYPAANSVPYLADMARFEWLIHRASISAEGTSFTISSRYALKSIWDAHFTGNFDFDVEKGGGWVISADLAYNPQIVYTS